MVRPDDFCEELYYPKRKRSHQCFEDKSKPTHTCLKHPKHLDNPDGRDQFQPKSKSPSKTCGPCSECNSFDTSIEHRKFKRSIGNSNALFKPDRPWVNPIPSIEHRRA
jgi:hypothetical protein